MQSSAVRLVLLVCVISVVGAVSVGCVPGAPEPRPTPSGSPEPRTPTPTESAEAVPDLEPEGIPVDIECADLLSAQAVYDYNNNLALLVDYEPEPGSTAASIVAEHGVSCRWQNLTSGENLDVSVARFETEQLTTIKNELVMTSNSVPTYGVEGYFRLDGPVGIADAFSDPYWILATSTTFVEPGDAAPIVAEAIANIG